ncbi:hypothetical protein GOP47_0010299 [Adiantum capillus-veneris]|uniref:Uncharacterized protein n=1 Tax=Adiantum capillus-veneris TaxID=13818 RepID=A0A9D4UUG7_ADICA|nr:hypothetical protein GOP47_0010299 [Adiantum capillus-veneris]
MVAVVFARLVFALLGLLTCGTVIFTLITDGSPFRMELLTRWMAATLVDFYVNVVPIAVWVWYKESSWLSGILWIVLLICFGSVTTCWYITWKLFQLSPQDPLYMVLLKESHARYGFVLVSSGRQIWSYRP